jgi:hypothetical protein
VTSPRIRGDYGQGLESMGLDSVTLSAVSGPGRAALLLRGIAAQVGMRRRRVGR